MEWLETREKLGDMRTPKMTELTGLSRWRTPGVPRLRQEEEVRSSSSDERFLRRPCFESLSKRPAWEDALDEAFLDCGNLGA